MWFKYYDVYSIDVLGRLSVWQISRLFEIRKLFNASNKPYRLSLSYVIKSIPLLIIIFFSNSGLFYDAVCASNYTDSTSEMSNLKIIAVLVKVRINFEFTFRRWDVEKTSGKITDTVTSIWTGIFWTSLQMYIATLAWLFLIKFLAVFNFFRMLHMFSLTNK
jgi:hypothetical protein